MKSTFGAICPKRSNTPCTPKSGEHADHTAPRLVAASMAIIASGMLGRKPATRSPATTPADLNPSAVRATSSFSCQKLICRRAPRSFLKIMAVCSPRYRSRFSAKFRRALGKKRAPGMRFASLSTGPPPQSARTSAKCAISSQKSPDRSMDHAYKSTCAASNLCGRRMHPCPNCRGLAQTAA